MPSEAPSPKEVQEIERVNKFGTHWRVRAVGPDGRIHEATVTKPRGGWPFGLRDKLRAEVQARALTQSHGDGQ